MASRIVPYVARVLTSSPVRRGLHKVGALPRALQGRTPTATLFYSADDPMSHLMVDVWVRKLEAADVALRLRTVQRRPASMYPAPERYRGAVLRDTPDLARRFEVDLAIPPVDAPPSARERAAMLLARCEELDDAPRWFRAIGSALWTGDDEAMAAIEREAPAAQTGRRRIEDNERALRRLGHYAGATIWFEGEWYPGVDRLVRLRDRLVDAGRLPDDVVLPAPPAETLGGPANAGADGPELEFFFSVRSPYSYLALERTFDLADHYGIPLRLRPVLPMVMRELPVPRKKAIRLLMDAAHEARRIGLPFGLVADPVGPGIERSYALIEYARDEGVERAFLSSCMRGAWAEALDLARDDDLRRAVERAGLSWEIAEPLVRSAHDTDAPWRMWVEDNHAALDEAGLWGVPSYRYGDLATWGQDRLFRLERAIVGE